MATNLLQNPSFEDSTYHQTFAELSVPEGWVAFWGEGVATHDLANRVGYARPEMKTIADEPPFRDPRRIRQTGKALMYFAFGKIMDAGVYQQVPVQAGARVRATAWAHGWSNDGFNCNSPHADDPHWSEGIGRQAFYAQEGTLNDDAARNLRFRLGIDPDGGVDWLAPTVVWGPGAHIYNVYAQVPPVEAVARAARVTVFLRCDALWPFKHNDAYWDDVELVAVADSGLALTVAARPVAGPARVGAAVLVEGRGAGAPMELDLRVSGPATVFVLAETAGGLTAVRRWVVVPEQPDLYLFTLSGPGAEPAMTTLQVAAS